MLVDQLVNVLQVGLTLPFVLFCGLLVVTWKNSFLAALREGPKSWTPEQWLLSGIVIGFSGNLLDNLYWGVTWLAVFYESPHETFLMSKGPLANIFFRQLPGIVSVLFHLEAAVLISKADYRLAKKVKLFCFAGVAVMAAMLYGLR